MKIKVGEKTLNINKWKGKTKKDFIRIFQQEEPNEFEVMETIVYSCIDENVVLSADEFRYVLSRIRAISIGEEINMEFFCDKCGKVFSETLKLDEILKTSYIKLDEINIEGARIKLGPVKNKELYQKYVEEDSDNDLLMRVERINGNSSFSFQELQEIFENLDVDVLEEVMRIYNEHKFKLNDVNTITCKHCKHEMVFEFDELPGFFPDSWLGQQ